MQSRRYKSDAQFMRLINGLESNRDSLLRAGAFLRRDLIEFNKQLKAIGVGGSVADVADQYDEVLKVAGAMAQAIKYHYDTVLEQQKQLEHNADTLYELE